MNMTSTYDHRIIQGAESGLFLKEVHDLLTGEKDFYKEFLTIWYKASAIKLEN
jgi:multifunctional 2-oxoglutarate metabolism enzyme